MEMSDRYTGGCACGAVRFEINDKPAAMVDCQCRDCQHRSGTGHGSYVTFTSRAGVKLTGQAKTWDVAGDSGTVKRHGFCPVCGAPVHLTIPAAPDIFIVHAAALDDPAAYKPQFVTYTVSGHAWDAPAPGAQVFDRMPPPAA
jgi:hypothetical protein